MTLSKKIIFAVNLVSLLGTQAYAGINTSFFPVQTQQIQVTGKEIYFNAPFKANCPTCMQAINSDHGYYVTYTNPTKIENGQITYWFIVNDSNFPFDPLCGYQANIPFTIEENGKFNIMPSNFPAPLLPNPPGKDKCEKHAFVAITKEGDQFHFDNQIMK